MEIVRQIRMALWMFSLQRQLKLLNKWKESKTEDTRTMALMLLCFLNNEEMDDGDE